MDGCGDSADLARDKDAELLGMVMTAIALVDVDSMDFDAG